MEITGPVILIALILSIIAIQKIFKNYMITVAFVLVVVYLINMWVSSSE